MLMVTKAQQQTVIDRAVNSGIDAELKNLRKKVKEQKAEFKKLQQRYSTLEKTYEEDEQAAFDRGADAAESDVYTKILRKFSSSFTHGDSEHAWYFIQEAHDAWARRGKLEEENEKLKKRLETWKTNAAQEALTWVTSGPPGRFIRITPAKNDFFVSIGLIQDDDMEMALGCGSGEDFVEALTESFTDYKETVL